MKYHLQIKAEAEVECPPEVPARVVRGRFRCVGPWRRQVVPPSGRVVICSLEQYDSILCQAHCILLSYES